MIKLTIRQMEYFQALAQARHFGRAAKLAGVTQPALSAQIAEMEDKLQCRLFQRGGRTVELTEDARALQPMIDDVLDRIREIVAKGRRGRPAMEGRLRLGIIPTLAPYILPRALPELRTMFPGLVLELRETVTATLLEETASGRLDAALVALPVERAGLVVTPLFDDRFLLALSATEPGYVKPPIPPESPVLEKLMLLEEGHCMREQALAICGGLRPTVMTNYGATSLTTLLQMVAHGMGVTLVPQVAVSATAAMPNVRIVPFAEPAPFRTIALAVRRHGDMQRECAAIGAVISRLFGGPSGEGEAIGEIGPHDAQGHETGDEGRPAVADAVAGHVDPGVDDA